MNTLNKLTIFGKVYVSLILSFIMTISVMVWDSNRVKEAFEPLKVTTLPDQCGNIYYKDSNYKNQYASVGCNVSVNDTVLLSTLFYDSYKNWIIEDKILLQNGYYLYNFYDQKMSNKLYYSKLNLQKGKHYVISDSKWGCLSCILIIIFFIIIGMTAVTWIDTSHGNPNPMINPNVNFNDSKFRTIKKEI